MTKSLEAPRKFQTYKQRHSHDINGVRPVMIPDDSGEWVNRFDAEHLADQLVRAQLRIAELENDEVHQRLANAEHQLHMAELAKQNLKASRRAQFRKRLAAERKVSELEARTLSFTLPDPSSKAFWGGTGKNETFYPSTYKRWLIEAIECAGVIAKVKTEVK